jgi:hypothetical protein
MEPSVSFANDIVPVFRQFRGSMMWRFDLTKYDDVKANAQAIYSQISTPPNLGGMPPAPYPPLTKEQIAAFKSWMDQGFPV